MGGDGANGWDGTNGWDGANGWDGTSVGGAVSGWWYGANESMALACKHEHERAVRLCSHLHASAKRVGGVNGRGWGERVGQRRCRWRCVWVVRREQVRRAWMDGTARVGAEGVKGWTVRVGANGADG